MRKGTKRKSTHKPAEEDQTNDSEEPSRNAEPEPVKEAAGKGAKVAKPEEEPEYFPEKRNLEDIWLEVFPLGTEWDLMEKVYEYKWNFSNLEEALEEGGELHNKQVYLFGDTQPESLPYKGKPKLALVPAVVAKMKLDWVPYVPLEKRKSQVERPKGSQIFILSCKEERASLSSRKLNRMREFDCCLPYFYNPLQENKLKQSTVVELEVRKNPNLVIAMFDWKQDDPEEFTDLLIKEKKLPANRRQVFINNICEATKAIREASESVEKAWNELDEKSRAAFEKIFLPSAFFKFDWRPAFMEEYTDVLIKAQELPADQKEPLKVRESPKKALRKNKFNRQRMAAFKDMKFYKFYPAPSPETPDASGVKRPYINRYFGYAHKVI